MRDFTLYSYHGRQLALSAVLYVSGSMSAVMRPAPLSPARLGVRHQGSANTGLTDSGLTDCALRAGTPGGTGVSPIAYTALLHSWSDSHSAVR